MSLIHSAELAGENPFEYLHAIALNAERASESPSDRMPWNFREALTSAGDAPTDKNAEIIIGRRFSSGVDILRRARDRNGLAPEFRVEIRGIR